MIPGPNGALSNIENQDTYDCSQGVHKYTGSNVNSFPNTALYINIPLDAALCRWTFINDSVSYYCLDTVQMATVGVAPGYENRITCFIYTLLYKLRY